MFGNRNISCEKARAELVAWLDDALSPRRAGRVAAHVDGCAVCSSEAGILRESVSRQRDLLRTHVADVGADIDVMWRRVKQRLGDPAPTGARLRLAWLWRPALAFGAAFLVVTLGVRVLGGADTVLISVGLEPPPPPLKQQADLFKEYPIIRNLDILERLDAMDTDPGTDPATPRAQVG